METNGNSDENTNFSDKYTKTNHNFKKYKHDELEKNIDIDKTTYRCIDYVVLWAETDVSRWTK